jgi:cupin fold WbuC family metalloprotein
MPNNPNNPDHSGSAKALPAPTTSTTLISTELIRQVVESSRLSPRKRIILPFHKGPEAPMHRMLNALQPYSYIQPHRHLHPPKAESVIILQGALLCFLFCPSGEVAEVFTLAAGSENVGVDSEPGVYHTFLALAEDTVIFEVKPGPYEQSSDKDFAPWAPAEGTPETRDYMEYLYSLDKGSGNDPQFF